MPKDLTPSIIERLKKTARDNPYGSIAADFDPNNFVFRSNSGLTLMLTYGQYTKDQPACWHMSMSYPRRAPRDEEADEVLKAFFAKAGEEARKVIKPEGANPNVLHYIISVE